MSPYTDTMNRSARRKIRRWLARRIEPAPGFPAKSWYGRCIHDANDGDITPVEATDWWDGVAEPDPADEFDVRPIWTRGIGSDVPFTNDHGDYMRKRQEAGYRISLKSKASPEQSMHNLTVMVDRGCTPGYFGIGNEPEGHEETDTPQKFLKHARESGQLDMLRRAYEMHGWIPCNPGLINPNHALNEWGTATGEFLETLTNRGIPVVAKLHNYAVEPVNLLRLGFKKQVLRHIGLPADNLLFLEESASGFIGAGATQEAIDRKKEEVTGPENAEWHSAGILYGCQDEVAVSPFFLYNRRRIDSHSTIMHPEHGLMRRAAIKETMQFIKDTQGFGTVADLAIPHSTAKPLDTDEVLRRLALLNA